MTPIFLLSLPRSGSTLLQRLLAAHPAIATASEPWFLLPLFLTRTDGHVYTSYHQRHFVRAFREFVGSLPEGDAVFETAVRRYSLTFYESACQEGETHFLDKTPRYHLIARELFDCFPDARFVLLWRNPLAVAASCMNTWCRGRFNLYHYRVDLYHGLVNLLDLQRQAGSRLFCLRYEDLVARPERALEELFAFLGVAPPSVSPTRSLGRVELRGSMGDRPLDDRDREVSTGSIDSWPRTLATPLRRRWARRYLRWLGSDRLAAMGYDSVQIEARLAREPTVWRGSGSDVARMAYGWYFVRREPALFRKKRALAREGIRVDVPSE